MKIEWDKISPSRQEKYKERAEYLIERGYVFASSKNELARRIYEGETVDKTDDLVYDNNETQRGIVNG